MKNKPVKCVRTGGTWEGVPTSNTMCGRFAYEDCYKSPGQVISCRMYGADYHSKICPNCADKMIEIINKAKSKDNSYIETEEYKESRKEYDKIQLESKIKHEKWEKEYLASKAKIDK